MSFFHTLTPDMFENLTYDLMMLMGLKNAVWRTPGRDGGRDIQGEYLFNDFSGHTRNENWYIECKRYEDSVAWPLVWEKIAFAESNSADVLLFITSSSLSPQAVDEVNKWNEKRKRPSIRFWCGTDLERIMRLHPNLMVKYNLSKDPVRDAAVSILPLTDILIKLANTVKSEKSFGLENIKSIDALHAIAELISIITGDVKSSGSFKFRQFRDLHDRPEWIPLDISFESLNYERHSLRTLLAIINLSQFKTNPTLRIIDNNIIINIPNSITPTTLSDLNTIALWGNLVLQYNENAHTIEVIDVNKL